MMERRCTFLVVTSGKPSDRSKRIWWPNTLFVPVPVRSPLVTPWSRTWRMKSSYWERMGRMGSWSYAAIIGRRPWRTSGGEAVVGRPSGHDLGGWLAARANSPALLGPGACRRTRCRSLRHYAQTGCGKSEDEARLTRAGPGSCAARRLPRARPGTRPRLRHRAGARLSTDAPSSAACAQRRCSSKSAGARGARRRACCGAEQRRAWVGRRVRSTRFVRLTCRELSERSRAKRAERVLRRPRRPSMRRASQAVAREPDRRGRTPTGARPRLCQPMRIGDAHQRSNCSAASRAYSPLARHQLRVRARSRRCSPWSMHDDAVGPLHGREAVRDDQRRAVAASPTPARPAPCARSRRRARWWLRRAAAAAGSSASRARSRCAGAGRPTGARRARRGRCRSPRAAR